MPEGGTLDSLEFKGSIPLAKAFIYTQQDRQPCTPQHTNCNPKMSCVLSKRGPQAPPPARAKLQTPVSADWNRGAD